MPAKSTAKKSAQPPASAGPRAKTAPATAEDPKPEPVRTTAKTAKTGKAEPAAADAAPASADAAPAPPEPGEAPEPAPAPTEPADEPEPLNRAERRAARRKGAAQPLPTLPRGKVGRGTQVQAPRQWANRRSGG